MQETIEEQIIAIINNAPFGSLATSVNGQPRVRPMAFRVVEGLKLWSSTYTISGKYKELEQNKKVEVCFVDNTNAQVRIEGVVDLTGGPEKKRRLLELNPHVGRHFRDEHDPKYAHIEIVPTSIRWKPFGFSEYQYVDL